MEARSDYRPAGYCPGCGYMLDPGRCPECGRDVVRPWRVRPRAYRRWRAAVVLTVVVGIGLGGWWFGPELAERYTPSSVLVWVWDTDAPGAQWAQGVLRVRIKRAYVASRNDGMRLQRAFHEQMHDATDHDWRGTYAGGPGFWQGRDLVLTETEAIWSTVSGLQFSSFMRGHVIGVENGVLKLEMPADRALLRSQSPFDSMLVPIRWGDWRFLVAPEELLDFCNDVNAGEPLCEFHLTRTLGRVAPYEYQVYGRPGDGRSPELPKEFRRRLLVEPIEATVKSADARDLPQRGRLGRALKTASDRGGYAISLYELTLETQRVEDAFVGMRLYPADRQGMAHVVRIKGSMFRAVYVEFAPPDDCRPPPAGTAFSTLAPPPVADWREDDDRRDIFRGIYWRNVTIPAEAPEPDRYLKAAEQRRFMLPWDWNLRELALELKRAE